MNADPSDTNSPKIRPARENVGETLAGLNRFPASGLFIVSASPILAKPTIIPTVIRTIPRIRKNTGAAPNFGGVVKDEQTSFEPAWQEMFKRNGTLTCPNSEHPFLKLASKRLIMVAIAHVKEPSLRVSEGLTVTRPTHNRAVVQLVRPALTLRDNVMRLPTTLTLHSTTC